MPGQERNQDGAEIHFHDMFVTMPTSSLDHVPTEKKYIHGLAIIPDRRSRRVVQVGSRGHAAAVRGGKREAQPRGNEHQHSTTATKGSQAARTPSRTRR